MRTSMRAAMVFAWTLTAGCDAPDDRAELALLAEQEQDPEVRAELERLAAAGADEDDEDAAMVPGASDELAMHEASEGTCFFCPPPPTLDPNTTPPVVINPYVQVNQQNQAILYMAAASSFIAVPGATVKLQVPYSTQTYGPFALQYDVSGTQIRANVTSGWPAGTCRLITVTNPNNLSSSPGSACR